MPTGTIKNVYQIDGKKKPGAVVFTDGKRFSTFDRAPIAAATGQEGKVAEYTTETNGEYTNLKTLRIVAGESSGTTATPAPRAGQSDPGLVKAINDLTAAVGLLAANVASRASGAGEEAVVKSSPVGNDTDPLAAAQSKLADAIGAPAADAQFTAIRKRHAKNPEKLAEAAKALLEANGVEAA